MKAIPIPGGGTALVASADADQVQRTIDARHAFVLRYCRERGWPADPDALTFAQIFEIRAQPGWKNCLDDGKEPKP